jgi:8-amino-7-oxononanoate synthase
MKQYQDIIDNLKQNGGYRQLRTIRSEGRFVYYNEKKYLNLSSNDYLGISSNQGLQEDFLKSLENKHLFLFGSTSSRLLTGNYQELEALENMLVKMYHREAALVFNSGYHANIGILPALTTKRDLILADKYVHASIIDGMRLSEARCERYRHNNLEHLESLLKKHRSNFEKVFIVTESVFSMDGDHADLIKLCELKDRFDAFLYVDEAHAFGVNGNTGLGLCEEQNCIHRIDFIVGTFGKAIASQGAFVITSNVFRDFLINTMRPIIFSTALAPINVLWTTFVLNHLHEFNAERKRLAEISLDFRKKIIKLGFKTKGCSQIVPLLCGENEKSIALSEKLKEAGFWALPVRYPTVPKGEARIRFSFRPDMLNDEIDYLLKILSDGNN